VPSLNSQALVYNSGIMDAKLTHMHAQMVEMEAKMAAMAKELAEMMKPAIAPGAQAAHDMLAAIRAEREAAPAPKVHKTLSAIRAEKAAAAAAASHPHIAPMREVEESHPEKKPTGEKIFEDLRLGDVINDRIPGKIAASEGKYLRVVKRTHTTITLSVCDADGGNVRGGTSTFTKKKWMARGALMHNLVVASV